MGDGKLLSANRRDYGNLSLNEEDVLDSPIAQFERWFGEVLKSESMDPTAMVLSTVDELGYPDSRVVLLKGLEQERFVFYTNYQSAKGIQIRTNAHVALNFYWPSMARQVRVRGLVKRVSKAQSDAYFASRPLNSQRSAIASPQSRPVEDRSELLQRLNLIIAEHQQEVLARPSSWGGYAVIPIEIEFWQGRDNRLHDRIQYYQRNNRWEHRRLAP